MVNQVDSNSKAKHASEKSWRGFINLFSTLESPSLTGKGFYSKIDSESKPKHPKICRSKENHLRRGLFTTTIYVICNRPKIAGELHLDLPDLRNLGLGGNYHQPSQKNRVSSRLTKITKRTVSWEGTWYQPISQRNTLELDQNAYVTTRHY